MNQFIARFTICAAVCLPFAILAAMGLGHEMKRIEVRTTGSTGDVVVAIEALDRSDLEVKVSPATSSGPVPVAAIGTLGMAFGLWIAVTLVTSLERFLLKRQKKEP